MFRHNFCSLLLFIFSFLFLSSCLTTEPPALTISEGEQEYLIEGTEEFPEGMESIENGFYYPLNPTLSTEDKTAFLVVSPAEGFSGEILFFLHNGERLTCRPADAAEGKESLLLPSFTLDELAGIGLPEIEGEKMPRFDLRSGGFLASLVSGPNIAGITIANPAPESWKIVLDTKDWSREITENSWYLKIDYRKAGTSGSTEENSENGTGASLSLQPSGGEKEEYDFFPKTGENSLFFYSERYNRLPEEIILSNAAGLTVTSVEISLRENETVQTFPLTADTGTILHYPHEFWRNPGYELFRWSLYPEIIQVVTDSYKTQSRFFKRLAFYVEKPGFVGRLATNDEIASLHGWNAHDYRPSDLADFFQQARQENFGLNSEEELLRDILIENGVLRDTGGEILPGTGALVGTSIETFYEQRLIFMAHESIHGIYFTSGEYRKECAEFWESLSEDEQKFWINFFSYRGYNVEEDRDLLINETTTYLLQQPSWQADDYFVGFITPKLLASRGYLTDWLIPFLLENPGLFRRQEEAMEARLQALSGFNAATIHDLLPKNRSRWFIFGGMEEKWRSQVTSQQG